MKNIKLKSISVIVFSLIATQIALADQPMLQDGKKTVFQRVVSNPGAVLFSDADASKKIGTPRTFTSFYIYERKGNMVRVGVSAHESDGWINRQEVTEWPQAITMVFTDQTTRQPVLFFKNKEELINLCTADSIKASVDKYVELFSNKNSKIPTNSPVIAMEPYDSQVSQNDFYLLPVLDIDTQFDESGTRLLEVASLDPGVSKTSTSKRDEAKFSDSQGMSTGIVFVVDTTISMKPYIEETKETIRKIFNRIQKSKAKDKIAIAVVAFRSNVQKAPLTEYNTRVISDFVTVTNREKLETFLEDLDEATASTHDINEDSLAGVKVAVDKLSWEKVDGKMLLLVSDAGPLVDDTAKTGMSSEAMADYLRTNNIYLVALHVKSPKSAKNHSYAEKNYRELSKMSDGRSSYIPIDATTPAVGAANFSKVGDAVANIFCQIAENQVTGKQSRKPASKSDENVKAEEKAGNLAEKIGYAMQLQFAGNRDDVTAPHVVKAWIADADLSLLEENPNDAPVPVVEPAVLLTKLQLSMLRKQVKLIIDVAEEAFLRSDEDGSFNFYDQLVSAAAQMSRDPSAFTDSPGANLEKKGVLDEVLEGLPYKSQVLRFKRDDWSNMSVGQQREFIKRLKGLIALYDEYDSDTKHWESFGTKDPNEWVYRVPLSVLP
ncbi:MAG: VWA domain-containing protein [Lachnospiraceae bacterium]|jgi:serine/threonine-protein kinase PpkA|nr:VWA domain-containing protein [Lachnospiraceae bacterium]